MRFGDMELTEDELQVLTVMCIHYAVWMAGSESLARETPNKISKERVDATWHPLFDKKLLDSTIDGPVITKFGVEVMEAFAFVMARQRAFS